MNRKTTLHHLFVICLASLGIVGCAHSANQAMFPSGLNAEQFNAACVSSGCLVSGNQCICQNIVCNADGNTTESTSTSSPALAGETALSLWNDDAVARKELINYINTITKEGMDYIPPKDRIAVFDLDGTLVCETDPNYLDYNIYVYRVLEDPDYKDLATQHQIDIANQILQQNETGITPDGLDVAHQTAYMEVFAGMTLPEYQRYVQAFLSQPAPGYNGMKRGESFYKPMLEVINYLQANQFTVYIVSGTDRLQVRAIVDGKIDIPNSQIIGSDGWIIAKGQAVSDDPAHDNLNYVYRSYDELVRSKVFIVKNLKMNKVAVIAQEIGQQPVLSFGNSTGDASMAEYVITHNPYKSKAFMLLADDTERENGNLAKAEKMKVLCENSGWIPVSMKNDWKTIYGDGVTKK
ncbi:MAG: haloacid dehalogenase-like hydrolase [Proteobacteria bacterium]|nr:haloacid dehalogenase-like hydrolase [Pseudomonadota bacterium]